MFGPGGHFRPSGSFVFKLTSLCPEHRFAISPNPDSAHLGKFGTPELQFSAPGWGTRRGTNAPEPGF
eukprot:8286806-Karenia_brevis.AAC.1